MGIIEVVSGRSKLGRRWRDTGREHSPYQEEGDSRVE